MTRKESEFSVYCEVSATMTQQESKICTQQQSLHKIPEWLLYIYAVLTAWIALTFLVCLVLVLTTVFWRCSGQSIDIDGTHEYPEGLVCKHLCWCFRLKKSKKKKITKAHRAMKVTEKITKDKRVRSAVAKIGRQTSRTILPKEPLIDKTENDNWVSDPVGATKPGFYLAEDDDNLIVEDIETTSLSDIITPNNDTMTQTINKPNGTVLELIKENTTDSIASILSENRNTNKKSEHTAALMPILSEKSNVSQKNVIISIVDTENEDIDDTTQLLPSVPSTSVENETTSKNKQNKNPSRKNKK